MEFTLFFWWGWLDFICSLDIPAEMSYAVASTTRGSYGFFICRCLWVIIWMVTASGAGWEARRERDWKWASFVRPHLASKSRLLHASPSIDVIKLLVSTFFLIIIIIRVNLFFWLLNLMSRSLLLYVFFFHN